MLGLGIGDGESGAEVGADVSSGKKPRSFSRVPDFYVVDSMEIAAKQM